MRSVDILVADECGQSEDNPGHEVSAAVPETPPSPPLRLGTQLCGVRGPHSVPQYLPAQVNTTELELVTGITRSNL